MDFRTTDDFSVNKEGTGGNFAAGGSVDRRTRLNALCRDKNLY
jgi:hypothetical protein